MMPTVASIKLVRSVAALIPVLLLSFVGCSGVDSDMWHSVSILQEQLPTPQDLRRQNAFEYDPFLDPDDDGITITIPMDYFESERERAYREFWQVSATEAQKQYYDLLTHLSLNGPHQADAHWELKEMALYGKHCFPHNKTQALYHLEKFNELTRGSNASALFELSVIYSTGLFGAVEQDTPRAIVLLQESSKLGDLRAKQALAYRYLIGLDVPKDKGKAGVLYGSISNTLRNLYTFEEWNFRPPIIESYDVRLPDLEGGLLGKELAESFSSAKRLRKQKPKTPAALLLPGKNPYLATTLKELDIDESDYESNRIIELYYAAYNSYYGTYTMVRNPNASASILEMVRAEYGDSISSLETISKIYYSLCLDLLGEQYLRGEGVECNIDKAEQLFNDVLLLDNTLLKEFNVRTGAGRAGLGIISQYYKNNFTAALEYYHNSCAWGQKNYQQAKLIDYQSSGTNVYMCLQTAGRWGYFPAFYELAKQQNNEYSVSQLYQGVEAYRSFVEGNEQYMAPYLKNAFLSLLREETEIALWYYAMAAEQGYSNAQLSAAWLLYQPPRVLEEPPIIPDTRLEMALRYYDLSQYGEANTVMGDILYRKGDYENARKRYMMGGMQGSWNLGYMYQHGLGVKKDYHLAKQYYERMTIYKELRNYEQYSTLQQIYYGYVAHLNVLLLQLQWAASHVLENFLPSNSTDVAHWIQSKWDQAKKQISYFIQPKSAKLKPAQPHITNTSISQQKPRSESWSRKLSHYLRSFSFDIHEDLIMIVITLVVVLISFIVSFLRGNVNIRFNGMPLPVNNGDRQEEPNEQQQGQLNVVFFAI